MGNDPFALHSGILPAFYEVFSANSFQLSWFNRGTKENRREENSESNCCHVSLVDKIPRSSCDTIKEK
jgi:hypothetical protein